MKSSLNGFSSLYTARRTAGRCARPRSRCGARIRDEVARARKERQSGMRIVAARRVARPANVLRRESVGTDSRDLRLVESVNTPAEASGAKFFFMRAGVPC
jgi:hypothetical protein